MLKRCFLLIAVLSVGACTVTPYRQALDEATRASFPQPLVYASVDDRGVGVQYLAQDSSGIGAQYGLIGALVSATVDSIVNAGPIELAQNGADKIAQAFDHRQMNDQFTQALQSELRTVALFAQPPTIKPLDAEREWKIAEFDEPAVLVTKLEYALAQDMRSLEVVLTATALSRSAAADKSRKAKDGRVYRNRFEYHSQLLDAYPDKAPDQTETPPEVKADHYLAQWLAADGSLLRQELNSGVAELAHMLAADIENPAPIDAEAQRPAKEVIASGDGRNLVRFNIHPFMGALSSEPAGFVEPPANGVSYYSKPDAE